MNTPQWVIVKGSVTGPSHIREGVTNQDATLVTRLGTGAYVLAVADGAGSRSRSDQGARLAMDVIKGSAGDWFGTKLPADTAQWQTAVRMYAEHCLTRFDSRIARLVEEIRTEERDPRTAADIRGDFATTLFAVIAAPPYFAYFAVGDGFLVVSRRPGGSHLLQAPSAGRDNAGETVFITSRDREAHLRPLVLVDDRVRGICLATDGLIEATLTLSTDADGEQMFSAPAEFEGYFNYFAKPGVDPSDLERQLQSTQFAETSGDDKSMIIAVRP
ncbi:PP2C family serine/threonine-protein phosphatase [Nonomuraea sp. B19D2]|uniref:PP2C family serine/threonine-protein phosphatase n=1 Tax=Nonomuraea sp. B19D2 TaxID=3159561 RepID=UPI0032DB7B61